MYHNNRRKKRYIALLTIQSFRDKIIIQFQDNRFQTRKCHVLQTYWLKHVVKLTRCLLLPTLCVIDLKTKPCRDISEAIKLWDFLGYFSSSILCGKYTSGERSKECLDKYVQLGCNSTHANYLGSKPYHKHSQPCLVTRKATTIYVCMYVCMEIRLKNSQRGTKLWVLSFFENYEI